MHSTTQYENKVYTLPKHLEKIGVELETLRKDLADYIGLTLEDRSSRSKIEIK